jgi:uncharacterized protein YhjY with autotransporter beta-barrel domain
MRSLARLWFTLGALCAASLAIAQTAVPPSVSQITFAPATIQSGATSQLTITLTNPNAAPAVLQQALTDSFPAGLVVATPSAIGGSCPGAAAGAAGRSVTLPAGAAIPAAASCTVQVNVTGTSTARNTYYADSIGAGALVTNLGTNLTAASGSLTVQSAPTVPNIIGLSQTAAASALQAAGFTLGPVTRSPAPATIPYNAVVSQTPAAGTAATPGSAVAVTISTGAGLATNPNRPLTSVANFVAPYQQSEAAALERLCAAVQSADPASLSSAQRNLGANCNAIIGTYGGGVDASGLKQTLDALSGKQSTAQQRTGVQFAGAQFTNIGARLAQLRQGASGASFSNLDLGLPVGNGLSSLLAALDGAADGAAAATTGERGGAAGADADSIGAMSRLGFFVNGSLRRGSQDTTTYETPFDFRSNSVTAGLDYRLTNRLILGLALGHSSGTTTFSDGSGRLDSSSNSASLYATFYQQAFYVDVMGSYGHIDYAAARSTTFSINPNVQAIPSNCSAGECSVITTGSTGAQQLAFDTNIGYSFNQGAFTYGPDVSINYTRVRVNGFEENDPNESGLALTFGEDTGESLLGKAGGHIAYAIKLPFGVLLPEARAHYIHEFKNDQRALSVHFSSDPFADTANGPVSNFVVFTDAPERSYFDWAAGFSAQFPFGVSAFADYNSIVSSTQRVHEFALGIRIEHAVR